MTVQGTYVTRQKFGEKIKTVSLRVFIKEGQKEMTDAEKEFDLSKLANRDS